MPHIDKAHSRRRIADLARESGDETVDAGEEFFNNLTRGLPGVTLDGAGGFPHVFLACAYRPSSYGEGGDHDAR